jgi:hypothetical protein
LQDVVEAKGAVTSLHEKFGSVQDLLSTYLYRSIPCTATVNNVTQDGSLALACKLCYSP